MKSKCRDLLCFANSKVITRDSSQHALILYRIFLPHLATCTTHEYKVSLDILIH